MKNSPRPMHFDPSQEMQTRETELRYCLDETALTVDLHAHPFYEIYFFVEGNLESYVVGNRSYHLRRGDILMIPPSVLHHPVFHAEPKRYVRFVLWLSMSFLDQLIQTDPDIDYVMRLCHERKEYMIRCSAPALAQSLENHLQTIWYESQGNALCKKAYEKYSCLGFLIQLNRTVSDQNVISSIHDHKSPLLDQILAFVQENYAAPLTLKKVAEHFFVSPSTVEHLFSQKLGKSFYRYVIECRLITAQSMIQQGIPLKEVSRACGYSDYSNFYKSFVKELGVSPSDFRSYATPDHFLISRS